MSAGPHMIFFNLDTSVNKSKKNDALCRNDTSFCIANGWNVAKKRDSK